VPNAIVMTPMIEFPSALFAVLTVDATINFLLLVYLPIKFEERFAPPIAKTEFETQTGHEFFLSEKFRSLFSETEQKNIREVFTNNFHGCFCKRRFTNCYNLSMLKQ
jgi:hypothetical protein